MSRAECTVQQQPAEPKDYKNLVEILLPPSGRHGITFGEIIASYDEDDNVDEARKEN